MISDLQQTLRQADDATLKYILETSTRDLKVSEARQSLVSFTEWTYPRYETALPHRQIAAQLERVEKGEIDRLMLLVAPRHGKSELASRRFPAWYLGRHPERQFISASATADLASDFGRDVRNIIASPEYAEVFSTRLAEDSQAKGKWSTSEGGNYYAVGVGGSVMGRGAHVFLIDDPFGAMADAQSETKRKEVWDWYTGTVYNRLQSGGAIVIINHRMHEDDLTGRLLQQQAAGGDRWAVVELKATPEQPLWPEVYGSSFLQRVKQNTLPRFWSALYEQNPTPDEGTYFLAEWLRPYMPDQRPDLATLHIYGASDFAVSDGKGDYTVHVVVGVDPNDRLWLLDVWRGQTAPDAWIDEFCAMVKEWRPIGWARETGQIRGAVGPFMAKRMAERNAYTAFADFPTKGDKTVRAQSIRGRMSQRGLYVPALAEWLPDVQSELVAFPAGRHDDAVDALGLIGQVLDQMSPGRDSVTPKAPKVVSVGGQSTVTMNEMWAMNERGRRTMSKRI